MTETHVYMLMLLLQWHFCICLQSAELVTHRNCSSEHARRTYYKAVLTAIVSHV